MRVGTWNVEYGAGEPKNRARLKLLSDQAADIWVLTETNDALDLSPSHRPVRSLQRPNGPPGARWVTIWSRWPFLERVGVADPERAAAALIDTPQGPLVVYGTVLPWHSDRGRHPSGVVVKNWSEFYRVLEEQSQEWLELRRRLPGVGLCVAGDLNMSLGGPHYYGTTLGRERLRAALELSGLHCATSWDRVPEGLVRHPMIDHVLLDRETADRCRVVAGWEGRSPDGVRLSDHSGVVVEVVELG